VWERITRYVEQKAKPAKDAGATKKICKNKVEGKDVKRIEKMLRSQGS